jgi:hypothetical protein
MKKNEAAALERFQAITQTLATLDRLLDKRAEVYGLHREYLRCKQGLHQAAAHFWEQEHKARKK